MSRGSDVVVVGGGVVGCAVAWSLAREGLSVTLLERDTLAAGASGAAAGMLLPFGESKGEGPFFGWALRSHALFPGLCAELRERTGMDPELEVCGALHVARDEAAVRRLSDRAQRLAAHGLAWLDAGAARAAEPLLAPDLLGALHAPMEAHVRSPLLARALAAAAAGLGARVERGVAVLALRREGDRVTGVETAAGPRPAGAVVVCAGAWTPALGIDLAIEPVRGQICAVDDCAPPLRTIVVGEETYLVPKRDGSVVVGATEERVGFECRVTAAGLATLLAAAPRLVPSLAAASFRSGWAGLRPATRDGLPAIGPAPGCRGLFVAAGHHRNGVLLAPITARLVADCVLGKALPAEAEAFRPARLAPA